jgi:hypothetical protein
MNALDLASSTQPFAELGAVDPAELAPTRLVLHWAAQIPAAAAHSLIEARSDGSHTAFGWVPRLRAFATEPIDGRRRAVLLPEAFEVGVLDDHDVVGVLGLTGHSLRDALVRLSADFGCGALEPAGYTLPDHPVSRGAPFERPAHLAELTSWFAAAWPLLDAVRESDPQASPVRCWPHHFDAATLITLDPDESDAEKARSIGIGFSPGDESYAEPYLYVAPWPYPGADALSPPEFGGWHTAGFVAAVFRGVDIVRIGPDQRPTAVARFIADAVAECRRILG